MLFSRVFFFGLNPTNQLWIGASGPLINLGPNSSFASPKKNNQYSGGITILFAKLLQIIRDGEHRKRPGQGEKTHTGVTRCQARMHQKQFYSDFLGAPYRWMSCELDLQHRSCVLQQKSISGWFTATGFPGWWFQPTPLKNMTSSIGMIIPNINNNIRKNITCSSHHPPVSYRICLMCAQTTRFPPQTAPPRMASSRAVLSRCKRNQTC